ncbi:MAG: tetratricopeptide repeat protein [Myxococcota bacterium]|nr:tetratricopeptide repeat protein [Myxococcota bacterium]
MPRYPGFMRAEPTHVVRGPRVRSGWAFKAFVVGGALVVVAAGIGLGWFVWGKRTETHPAGGPARLTSPPHDRAHGSTAAGGDPRARGIPPPLGAESPSSTAPASTSPTAAHDTSNAAAPEPAEAPDRANERSAAPDTEERVELPPVPPRVARMSSAARASRARALRMRASRLERRERTEQAMQLYRQALVYDPRHAQTVAGMARTSLALERPTEAVAWARRATALAPREPDLHVLLGDALQAAGRAEEARASWQRALEIDSRHRGARRRLRAR